MRGRLQNVRDKLASLLPEDPTPDELPIPEYATQDEVYSAFTDEEEEDSDGPEIEIQLSFDDMTVGEGVEVYWPGDKLWCKDVVLDKDLQDQTFHVEYISDGKKYWHAVDDFKVRVAC